MCLDLEEKHNGILYFRDIFVERDILEVNSNWNVFNFGDGLWTINVETDKSTPQAIQMKVAEGSHAFVDYEKTIRWSLNL